VPGGESRSFPDTQESILSRPARSVKSAHQDSDGPLGLCSLVVRIPWPCNRSLAANQAVQSSLHRLIILLYSGRAVKFGPLPFRALGAVPWHPESGAWHD